MRKKLALSAASILITLLLAEVALRILGIGCAVVPLCRLTLGVFRALSPCRGDLQ